MLVQQITAGNSQNKRHALKARLGQTRRQLGGNKKKIKDGGVKQKLNPRPEKISQIDKENVPAILAAKWVMTIPPPQTSGKL